MQEKLKNLLSLAAQLLTSLKLSEAKDAYQQTLTQFPGNAMGMLGLAMVYNRTGEPEKAKQMLEPLVVKISAPAVTTKTLPSRGKRKVSYSSTTAVNTAFEPAAVATIYAQMGYALHQLNQLSAAKSYYERSLSAYPSAEVQKLLEGVNQPIAKPSEEEIIIAQVNRMVSEERYVEAIEIMKKATDLSPDSPALLHGLGMLLRHLKQPDQALPLVQQAIILDPTNAIYYNDLGMIFQDRGEYQKAVTFYKRAIKIDPNYAIAYSNLGVTHKFLNQLDEAVAAYQKALALRPNMAAGYNNLGNLYRIMGNKNDAQKYLLKAIELVPDYIDAKKNLAALFSEV
jgi:tetratricopeptide (TPR) repeat protein